MSNLDKRTLEAIEHGENQKKEGYRSGYRDAIRDISTVMCADDCTTFPDALRALNVIMANSNNVIDSKYKTNAGEQK